MNTQRAIGPSPLLYDFGMSLQRMYDPGFPIEITTTSREVVAAAEESWRYFQRTFSNAPLHLRIGVPEGGPA